MFVGGQTSAVAIECAMYTEQQYCGFYWNLVLKIVILHHTIASVFLDVFSGHYFLQSYHFSVACPIRSYSDIADKHA